MREILFRGKAINRDEGYHRTEYKNGEWVYGLVTKLYDEQFKNLPAEMTNTNGISGIEIDHKTIGQYTGMLDKNGKKIFEGDILKIKSCDYDYEYTTQVYYSCHTLCVDIYGQDYDSTAIGFADDIWDEECCEVEVIGNIYDNPELLGDKKNV